MNVDCEIQSDSVDGPLKMNFWEKLLNAKTEKESEKTETKSENIEIKVAEMEKQPEKLIGISELTNIN